MAVSAIVLAAGQGKRMHPHIKKQYMELKGHPLLYYSLAVFCNSPSVDRVVLVTGKEDISFCKEEIVDKYKLKKVCAVIAGGNERYDSVEQGLNFLNENSAGDEVVLIHDGARPFPTGKMIEDSISTAREYGACTVGVPAKDTIKVVDADHFGVDTPDRSKLYQIQTPQTFKLSVISEAYKKMRAEGADHITDDTMLVEQFSNTRVKIIDGDYRNIKVTTPEDLILAGEFV